MNGKRNLLPVLGLFIAAPLIAEFLEGDFPITHLHLLLVLAPMYGGGALLIRELARRFQLRWPSIVLLALAYGVLEEGVVSQSLFNPDYANGRLMDPGFVPALGIGIPWTMLVLTLHTVWSISVPIALVEELSGPARTEPWLGRRGLAVVVAVALLGAASTTLLSYMDGKFIAEVPQLAAVVLIAALLVIVALRLPARTARAIRPAPSPWSVLAVSLLAGAVFFAGFFVSWVHAGVAVSIMAVVQAGMVVLALRWSRRIGWGGGHRVALVGGAVLTNAWRGFTGEMMVPTSPAVAMASHIVFALAAVAVVIVAALTATRQR